MNQEISKKIAGVLLEIQAIKLRPNDPFTWASGWKSPIYCDNRMSLSYPDARTKIKNALSNSIRENFPEVEAIAGVATAGIPQGALVAEALDLPFIYVRSKAKVHGMGNQIEGKVVKGQKVVVIEDLISTAGSSLKAIQSLRESEIDVLGMMAIFTYEFPVAEQNLKAAKVPVFTLSNYSTLIDVALERKIIDESNVNLLQEWRKSPETWGAS